MTSASTIAPPRGLTADALIEAYRVMRTIRVFEERLHEEYATGDVPGAVHLYAGQEAVAAGVCAHLHRTDYVTSTHRGHGHAIAKGCDVTAMMREVYGKAGGSCGGKGGSMHIADLGVGMLGANGVAAGGVPLACGVGLSAKVRGTDQVAVAFVGDGGANQGAFAESLVLAAVWRLPVVFVVEDNGYAQATASRYHLNETPVSARAAGVGIPGATVDGHDFFAVHEAAGAAVERARTGGGPTLLEARAGRYFGHMEGWDQQAYRGEGEADRMRAAADCLDRFAARVRADGSLSEEAMRSVDAEVASLVAAAVADAAAAPPPDPDTLLADVHVSY